MKELQTVVLDLTPIVRRAAEFPTALASLSAVDINRIYIKGNQTLQSHTRASGFVEATTSRNQVPITNLIQGFLN